MVNNNYMYLNMIPSPPPPPFPRDTSGFDDNNLNEYDEDYDEYLNEEEQQKSESGKWKRRLKNAALIGAAGLTAYNSYKAGQLVGGHLGYKRGVQEPLKKLNSVLTDEERKDAVERANRVLGKNRPSSANASYYYDDEDYDEYLNEEEQQKPESGKWKRRLKKAAVIGGIVGIPALAGAARTYKDAKQVGEEHGKMVSVAMYADDLDKLREYGKRYQERQTKQQT